MLLRKNLGYYKYEIKARLFSPKLRNGRYMIHGNQMQTCKIEPLNITKYGITEIPTTRFIQKFRPRVSIDIGANIGYYTMLLSNYSDRVYAIEPEPENFAVLKDNVEFNKKDNVTLFNKALGNRTGTVDLHCNSDNLSMHRVFKSVYNTGPVIPVEMAKLDDIVNDRIDLIKIDAEGSEYDILKGMPGILQQDNVILFEFQAYSVREAGTNPDDMFDFVKSFGYTIGDMKRRPADTGKLTEATSEMTSASVMLLFYK